MAEPNDKEQAKESEKNPSNLIPVPPSTPASGISILAHKIWVGNLDRRLTEQNILEFITRYGDVVSFKFMTHRQGPEKGEPRGYCFVEYATREQAERAKAALNGKKALRRRIAVEWARPDEAKKNSDSVSNTWDASSVSKTLQSGVSVSSKIAALEAKLKQMDEETKCASNPAPSTSQNYGLGSGTRLPHRSAHKSGKSSYRINISKPRFGPYDRTYRPH